MSYKITQTILDTLRSEALLLINQHNYIAAWAADFIGDVYVEVRTDGVDVLYFMTDFKESFVTNSYKRAATALKAAFNQ